MDSNDIDTARTTDRRNLHFTSLDDIAAEADRIVQAGHEGKLRHAGNWSAGQIMGHLAKWYGFTLDGFPFALPWYVRLAGKLMKKNMLTRPWKGGIKLPVKPQEVGPDPRYPLEEGLLKLTRALARVKEGQQMTHPSPLLGPLTHDEWIQLHLRHAELHFSYLHY